MTVILYYRYTPNRYTTTVQYYAQQQVGDYKINPFYDVTSSTCVCERLSRYVCERERENERDREIGMCACVRVCARASVYVCADNSFSYTFYHHCRMPHTIL